MVYAITVCTPAGAQKKYKILPDVAALLFNDKSSLLLMFAYFIQFSITVEEKHS
jgi:hypothetical protein